MIIVDANVLLYAYMPGFQQHQRAVEWLEDTLSEGTDAIGIIWHVATAFLRLSTNRRIFDEPFTGEIARSKLDELFAHPLVAAVVPTDRHWKIYSALLADLNLSGDIVMDAHIASVAIEHGASVASTDKDFRRFSDHVKVIDPFAK
ncbi:MAG: PIN domain-containing protein [Acidobacteria bacterium]|nr:PIN domain-containing protein [Acidobacteriota bacterium]